MVRGSLLIESVCECTSSRFRFGGRSSCESTKKAYRSLRKGDSLVTFVLPLLSCLAILTTEFSFFLALPSASALTLAFKGMKLRCFFHPCCPLSACGMLPSVSLCFQPTTQLAFVIFADPTKTRTAEPSFLSINQSINPRPSTLRNLHYRPSASTSHRIFFFFSLFLFSLFARYFRSLIYDNVNQAKHPPLHRRRTTDKRASRPDR